MEYKYTGIILNKKDMGEMDRIYTLYTLEGGKIRSLAKSVRKPHSKLASSLENITLADVTIVRTRGLGKITGSIIEHGFTGIKRDCDALFDVFASLSVFDRLVDLDSADSAIFFLLKSYLEAVDICALAGNIEKYELLRLGFLIKLLDALGYSMEVTACVSCGNGLSEKNLFFSAQKGGVVCQNCCGQDSMPIRANAVKMMRLFLQNNMAGLSKIKAEKKDCDGVRLAIDEFLRWTQ